MTAPRRPSLPVVDRGGGVPGPLPARAAGGARVLLINPPQTYPAAIADEFQSYFPVGLAMLAASAEAAGAAVRIIDCLAYELHTREGNTITFGLPASRLRAEIAAHRPDIVGITNPFTMFLGDAVRTAELVKAVDPGIQVIMGGIEPSLPGRNVQLLEGCAAIDVLVKGEGERTFVDLLGHYDRAARRFQSLDGVPGLLFRGDGAVAVNPDRPFLGELDELPLPAYHLVDMDRMYANPLYARLRGRIPGVRCLPVHTSRGCPYSCNFCSVHSQVGKAHRRHSPRYVREHLSLLVSRYGVRHFHFEDDNLTLNVPRALELFAAIEDLGITFDTPNGTRADSITEELAHAMRRAGARTVSIAVESGNQQILDAVVNKRLRLEDVSRGVRNLAAAAIPTIVFLIVGFPGEGEREVRDTLELGKRLAVEHGASVLVFVATPLPGTPLERECRTHGYFVNEASSHNLLASIRLNQCPLIATPQFTKADLWRWARDVLDQPGLCTVGAHIPLFFATTPQGMRAAGVVLGRPLAGRPPVSYWSRPPEPVAAVPIAAAAAGCAPP